MEPGLHLDPERLRVHAGRLAAIVDRLVPSPDLDAVLARALASGTPGVAELDRAASVLGRAIGELSELGAALHSAATAAEDAEGDVRETFLRSRWEQG